MGVNDPDLAHTLADAFNTLADEFQTLADRRTVLEHKLRFAHEQFQYLADKYAPAAPEIAETLANLQLPPHSPVDENASVPLPQRTAPKSQHQLAIVIRDGRRMASQLASLRETSKTTDSSRITFSQTSRSHQTSISTQLEHDYTVEGKKGQLQCPFTTKASQSPEVAHEPLQGDGSHNHVSHPPSDPICAAMFDESTSQAGTNATASVKCPIRFMDKHSPEEIANYVETHKHELPRSHEICLRRYQKNDQIRKLDSKYGNVVSMIEGLSQLHQPMLPEDEIEAPRQADADGASNERVETWAQAVSVTTDPEAQQVPEGGDTERHSHFDRPLKEVRVGESPSRPWGISVPVPDTYSGHGLPTSPPPAPVQMPKLSQPEAPISKPTGKCPFDHTKMSAMAGLTSETKLHPGGASPHPQASYGPPPPLTPLKESPPIRTSAPSPSPQLHQTQAPPQPTFLNANINQNAASQAPPMIFTGPVFIGYPIEQAIQFMNQYRGPQ